MRSSAAYPPASLGAVGPVHRNAGDDARGGLKPGTPLVGNDGAPIRDEIELEMLLGEGGPIGES